MRVMFCIMLVFAAALCGCADPQSLKHAEQCERNTKQDLNAGFSEEEVASIIREAFEVAYPSPLALEGGASDEQKAEYQAAVEKRDAVFGLFDIKIRQMVLSPETVKIALEQARTWVEYERSK